MGRSKEAPQWPKVVETSVNLTMKPEKGDARMIGRGRIEEKVFRLCPGSNMQCLNSTVEVVYPPGGEGLSDVSVFCAQGQDCQIDKPAVAPGLEELRNVTAAQFGYK